MMQFTDTEQRFADSPKGKLSVANARRRHEMSEAYKGTAARPWTDAMEAAAVRSLATAHARSAVVTTAMTADCARQLPIARIERDVANVMRRNDLRNAWRGAH